MVLRDVYEADRSAQAVNGVVTAESLNNVDRISIIYIAFTLHKSHDSS